MEPEEESDSEEEEPEEEESDSEEEEPEEEESDSEESEEEEFDSEEEEVEFSVEPNNTLSPKFTMGLVQL